MATVGEQLRALYTQEQLVALDTMREIMQDDPTVFDNHSREVRNPVGESNGKD